MTINTDKQTQIYFPPIKDSESLIKGLIQDDLKYNKLMYGFYVMDIEVEHFNLSLYEKIFTLIGFTVKEQTEELIEFYHKQVKKIEHINLAKHTKELEQVAAEIYNQLIQKRKEK